jgi:hypothetical protein
MTGVTDAELVTRGTPMTAWTDEELGRIGEARELQLASERPDGTLRPHVTIWVVRVDDGLYVRSAYGANNPWFRRAKASGVGRIRAGGLERDVTFADPLRMSTPTSTPPTTGSTTGTGPRPWGPSWDLLPTR